MEWEGVHEEKGEKVLISGEIREEHSRVGTGLIQWSISIYWFFAKKRVYI